MSKEPRVVTITMGGANFGDRLGFQVLQKVLPAHAVVQHEFSLVYQQRARWTLLDAPIDLLIIGLGGSIFKSLLDEDYLFQLIEHSKYTIGIFGTQYRTAIDNDKMTRLLDSIDVWYARSKHDIACFKGKCQTIHLGDWLISEFPMARPDPLSAEMYLHVGPEILWESVPLDITIQKIQRYKKVISSRLHPLLCALTSAEKVAYLEQREFGNTEASGKFQSMLIDVFGHSYPEDVFFDVRRQAVIEYKQFVAVNMEYMKKELARIL